MLHLGGADARQRVLVGLVEHLAAVVRDGDVVLVQPFHSHDHHVEDGRDLLLVGLDAGLVELEHHRGRGVLPFLHKEAAVRDDQVDARALHAGELADGAREFALQGTGVVDFLHEIRLADLDLVKNLEADALPHQTALAGDLDALVIDHFLRHQDGGAVVGKLVGDLVRLERLDDGTGVFRPQVGVEHLVLHAPGPERKPDGAGHHGHGAPGHGDALKCVQSAPESLDAVDKIGDESWHDGSPRSWAPHGAAPLRCLRR